MEIAKAYDPKEAEKSHYQRWETAGFFAPEIAAKGSALSKILNSAVSEIVRGNKPVTDWSGVVSNWRQSGGDTMRGEFEAAYSKQR